MLLRNSRVSLRPPGVPWYRAVGTLVEENAFRHVGSPGHSISVTASARRLSEHPKQKRGRRLTGNLNVYFFIIPSRRACPCSVPALLKL